MAGIPAQTKAPSSTLAKATPRQHSASEVQLLTCIGEDARYFLHLLLRRFPIFIVNSITNPREVSLVVARPRLRCKDDMFELFSARKLYPSVVALASNTNDSTQKEDHLHTYPSVDIK